jgi:hypothetical protein
MQKSDLTPFQIRQQGLAALVDALGAVGMVRFLQQFDQGNGDYTRDRDRLLANVRLEEAIAQIKQTRQSF